MCKVRKYGMRDQSHPRGSEPPSMGKCGRRAIRKKAGPHRMWESELDQCGGVDEPLDDSVEESGNQSQEK
jgi:hypothetical protein